MNLPAGTIFQLSNTLSPTQMMTRVGDGGVGLTGVTRETRVTGRPKKEKKKKEEEEEKVGSRIRRRLSAN